MPPKTQAFVLPAHDARSRAGSTLRRVQRLERLPFAHRILGVDPGLHRTGYGIIQLPLADYKLANGGMPKRQTTSGSVQLVEGGILTAKANDEFAWRLQSLYDGLAEVIREHQPEVMVIEELFSTYAHPRSALLMAHARGVLMLAAQQAGVIVHHFLPNEVKQVVTGNGHASKAAVQAAVRARLRLATVPEPADVADALAIALCFAARQQVGQSMGGKKIDRARLTPSSNQ